MIFLIGAFILFLAQFIWKKERMLNYFGFFSAVSLVVLSLMDNDLSVSGDNLAVMIVTGFAFVLYSMSRMLKA